MYIYIYIRICTLKNVALKSLRLTDVNFND